MSRRRVLSFVEDGWWSARMLSIALVRELQLPVTHYLRGRVHADVLRMITPYPGMRLRSIRRTYFKVAWRAALLGALLRRRAALVLVDNEHTYQQVQRFVDRWRVPVIEAREQRMELSYRWNGEMLSASGIVERVRGLV